MTTQSQTKPCSQCSKLMLLVNIEQFLGIRRQFWRCWCGACDVNDDKLVELTFQERWEAANAPVAATPQLPTKRLTSTATLPNRAHPKDAGLDLCSDEDLRLYAGSRKRVRTSFAAAIPVGHVGLCCPRSGWALRDGVTVLNAPGIIDEGYEGSHDVVLINLGERAVDIKHGDRIAQLVIVPVWRGEVVEVEELPGGEGGRGERGFGSSGMRRDGEAVK